MSKSAVRATSDAVRKTIKNTHPVGKSVVKKANHTSHANWLAGVALSAAGSRVYRLFKPAGVRHTERLPLLVMLHGCGQDAEALARSSGMNKLAQTQRFLVLYPEQGRTANAQGCWNWFSTRSGRAQREAESIHGAIQQACLLYPIDPERIALAGLSAGAGMAALMAMRFPEQFKAIAMHSGVPPGRANSGTSAVMAMQGRRITPIPPVVGAKLPALLVIHGSDDRVVAPINGAHAAQYWAAQWGAKERPSRLIRRGNRYPSMITDFRLRGHVVVSLCEIHGLGHAWSGGASGQPYSDPKGPDASAMIWGFVKKQFAS